MSEAIAHDQLRSLVDHIEAIGARNGSATELRRRLEVKEKRLQYVLDPLIERIDQKSIAKDRAVSAAVPLLGVRSDSIRHRVSIAIRKGSVAEALSAVQVWFAGDAWAVPELPSNAIGHVYLARADEFEGVYKIGFSRKPPIRIKQLILKHKIRLSLVATAIGTEFDEHIAQHDGRTHALCNEWFDLNGRWRAEDWTRVFMTPKRMWDEMRASA